MATLSGVYCVQHIHSRAEYFGQATDVLRRIVQHLRASCRDGFDDDIEGVFHAAVRRHGFGEFIWVLVLAFSQPADDTMWRLAVHVCQSVEAWFIHIYGRRFPLVSCV